ncbi:MAG TPA: alpha-L-arabinofuranosidase C-terminal domain-containing protein, partial [Paenibacillus sp.]
ERVELTYESEAYRHNGREIPAVSASASVDQEGAIHISLCNLNHADDSVLTIDLRGLDEGSKALAVSGTILVATEIDAHNTFEQPDQVVPQPFYAFVLEGSKLTVQLPPMSVTVLEIK